MSLTHLPLRAALLTTTRLLSSSALLRHYTSPTSGSSLPTKTAATTTNAKSLEHFTKTGEKHQDPTAINTRSYEYSQSGGDDMVARQSSASFSDSTDTNPASQKATAGKGNAVNPLELSPATPELSVCVEETVITQSGERAVGSKTGQGVTVKGKVVAKKGLAFRAAKGERDEVMKTGR